MMKKMLCKLLLIGLALILNYRATSGEVYKRKKIVQHGDLMIGALVPVHEQPSFRDDDKSSSKRKCGIIRDQYGVQRVEALLYMLDKINDKNQTSLLPGIKLGLEIRDECWTSSIALEETIDFIKDTIAIDETITDASLDSSMLDVQASPLGTVTRLNGTTLQGEKCYTSKEKQNQNKIMAVIGPGGSTVAINVQNLLQLFDVSIYYEYTINLIFYFYFFNLSFYIL
jgi:metabotropic glutamate receptor 1